MWLMDAFKANHTILWSSQSYFSMLNLLEALWSLPPVHNFCSTNSINFLMGQIFFVPCRTSIFVPCDFRICSSSSQFLLHKFNKFVSLIKSFRSMSSWEYSFHCSVHLFFFYQNFCSIYWLRLLIYHLCYICLHLFY